MKKLTMSVLFVMLLFGSAAAHDGALSLYTDATISDCSSEIGAYETDTIRLYYVRGTGVELGVAVEFRLEASIVDVAFLGTTWTTQIVITNGDIINGISLSAASCMGISQDVVYIGSIYIMYVGFAFPAESFTVSVKEDTNAETPGIYITECLPSDPIRAVLGGTFAFNGSCNPGVKEKSWGAIKELYR